MSCDKGKKSYALEHFQAEVSLAPSGIRCVQFDRYSSPSGEDRGERTLGNGKTSKNGKEKSSASVFPQADLVSGCCKPQTETSRINEEALIVDNNTQYAFLLIKIPLCEQKNKKKSILYVFRLFMK